MEITAVTQNQTQDETMWLNKDPKEHQKVTKWQQTTKRNSWPLVHETDLNPKPKHGGRYI